MGSEAPMLDIHEEQIVPFRMKVMPIPQFNPEEPKMISQGPDICIFNKEDPQEVLASWLFTQYLISNEAQLGYAETEGYIPVTLKAQESAEYQDYLSRKGEDDDHYFAKIEASELLLKHTSDTFVTPVFNGSTSLRSAAGQMIENVSKSARRKEKMNDAYIDKLYADVTSLFQAWKRTHLGRYKDFISFITTPSGERKLFLKDVQVAGERHGSLLFNLVTTG